MAEKDLIEVRSQIKKRKPTYKRVQSNQFAKLREVKWRRPKGMGNKVRRKRRGQASMPEVGYGSPKEVRGLNRHGFLEVIVTNVSDLDKVNTKVKIAMIGATVGGKKKLDILNEAKAKNIAIANIKNIDDTIKALTKIKKEKPKKVSEEKSKSTKQNKSEKSEKTAKTKTEEIVQKKTEEVIEK